MCMHKPLAHMQLLVIPWVTPCLLVPQDDVNADNKSVLP